MKKVLGEETKGVRTTNFSPDGKMLAYGGKNKIMRVVATSGDWPELKTMKLDNDLTSSSCAAFSPDSQFLAFGGRDKTVQVWCTRTWKQVWFHKFSKDVRAVQF